MRLSKLRITAIVLIVIALAITVMRLVYVYVPIYAVYPNCKGWLLTDRWVKEEGIGGTLSPQAIAVLADAHRFYYHADDPDYTARAPLVVLGDNVYMSGWDIDSVATAKTLNSFGRRVFYDYYPNHPMMRAWQDGKTRLLENMSDNPQLEKELEQIECDMLRYVMGIPETISGHYAE